MNNILYLRYAVEVEKTGSITKAAENMFMGQPHLSKAIKELEDSLGMSIFNRTSRGVVPTKRGAEFLNYARNIIRQVDEMEAMFKAPEQTRGRLDISVPRASYIAYAFSQYVSQLQDAGHLALNYRETNSVRAIRGIADGVNNLALIRYQDIHEKYFINALKERDIEHKTVFEFEYMVILSRKNPLAEKSELSGEDLRQYTEIVYGDSTIPELPISQIKGANTECCCSGRIEVYDRASRMEILCSNPQTFMWVSPMPEDMPYMAGLLLKKCSNGRNKYKDVLIYRKGYRLNKDEQDFCEKLYAVIARLPGIKG